MRIRYSIDSHGNMILNHYDRENFVRAFEEARKRDPRVQLGLDEENLNYSLQEDSHRFMGGYFYPSFFL